MKKGVMVTVRVRRHVRRRLEALARRERRSLSQQVQWLIERTLEGSGRPEVPVRGPTAGLLATEAVPEFRDFTEVRTLLSVSLLRRVGLPGLG